MLEFYTTRELAVILCITESTILKWRGKGYGPPYHRIFGSIRYLVSDVIEWIDESKTLKHAKKGA